MLLLFCSLVWAIRDGVDDTVDTAVVGIVDASTNGECTGTLIAPDLVLTARHCVSEILGFGCDATWGATLEADRFYVTTKSSYSFNLSDYHPVAKVIVDAQKTGLCGGDVALVVLKEPIDTTEAVPIAPRVDGEVAVGESYAAVGYGATDDNGTGSGSRRRRDGLVAACAGDCSGLGAAVGEWVGEAGVCAGDSGGPALDVEGRVVGVASRAAVSCLSPTYAALAGEGWAAFLKGAAVEAATAGGYPTPAWAVEEDSGSPGDSPGADSGDAEDSEVTKPAPEESCGGCATGGAGVAVGLLPLWWRRRVRRHAPSGGRAVGGAAVGDVSDLNRSM